MPNGNGLALNGGGAFPWTTLIQTVGNVAGQVLPAIVGARRVNGAIGGATPLEPGMVMPTAWAGMLPAVGAVGGMVVRGAARLAPILAKIAARVGRRVSVKAAVALARRVGPTAAAVALGISAEEMLELITADTLRVRRRRGISARDISKTRSTIRKVASVASLIQTACPPRRIRGFRRRRR
jgi:hypothetical protein